MSEAKPTDSKALGLIFCILGVGMTVSMGVSLGPAFIGIGLPFLVLGIIFMLKSSKADESAED